MLLGQLQKVVVPLGDSFKFYVEKISPAAVYVGSTTYNDNVFLIFSVTADSDADGTVTFAGVTKTVSAGTTSNVTFGKYGADSDATVGTNEGVIEFTNCTPACTTYNTTKAAFEHANHIKRVLCWRSSQTKIVNNMFYYQTELKEFLLPSVITEIGSEAFIDCPFKKMQISSNITSITEGAFERLLDIVFKVSSQSSKYKVVDGALIDTSVGILLSQGKTTTTIPSTVSRIGDYAFAYVTRLDSIDVPASVVSIGYRAFYNSSLSTIKFYSSTPATLSDNNVFPSGIRILVPAGSRSAYTSATYWTTYSNNIEEY